MESCKLNAVMVESMDQVNCKNVEGRKRGHIDIESETHIGWYRGIQKSVQNKSRVQQEYK